jgi:drug/metabolite transporter (DMT)-like permease
VGAYAWMLTGCASFTVMNALTHELRDQCDWQVIALFRTGLAFLFAVLLAIAAGAKLVFLRPRVLWVRSIAGSLGLLCTFFAMTRDGPVSNVLAITYIFPLWVAFLAWPMLGIKPGWQVLLSVVTAIGGVLLIRTPFEEDGTFVFNTSDGSGLAAVFAFFASFATATAMLGLNRLYWIDTRAVVAHFSGVAMLCCIGALIGFGHKMPLDALASTPVLATLLGIGITATVGQICLTKAFTIGAPAKVSVVGLSQIVMTLIVDVVYFGERFTAQNLAGMALVMAPTAWVILSQYHKRIEVTTSPSTSVNR